MRTVVRDDYLSPNPRSLQKERCLLNTGTNGSRLIEAWENNGKFYNTSSLRHTGEKTSGSWGLLHMMAYH
jgi:hypothetical protein